jgi:pentatricopeptide repeat protein
MNDLPAKALDLHDDVSSMMNTNLYSILFSACAALSNERAITFGKQLLEQMPQMLHDGLFAIGSALHMLMRFGEVKEAERLFSQMKKRDASSYGVMMNGYNFNGLPEKALDLFNDVTRMLDAKLYTIMYSICAGLCNDRAIAVGKQLLNQMPTIFYDDSIVVGSTIHMLMRFGEVKEAERLFSQMKKRDASSYGVMMNGYNLNGEPRKGLILFEELKRSKIKLDEPICVSLAGASSRIGMISMCRKIVELIPMELLNSLRVKNSVIDMWVSVLFVVDVRSTSCTCSVH